MLNEADIHSLKSDVTALFRGSLSLSCVRMCSEAVTCFSREMVAVVTGASSGIGEGTAVKLAQMGVGRLCITGRNKQALESTKQRCIKAGVDMKDSDVVTVTGKTLSNCKLCRENIVK